MEGTPWNTVVNKLLETGDYVKVATARHCAARGNTHSSLPCTTKQRADAEAKRARKAKGIKEVVVNYDDESQYTAYVWCGVVWLQLVEAVPSCSHAHFYVCTGLPTGFMPGRSWPIAIAPFACLALTACCTSTGTTSRAPTWSFASCSQASSSPFKTSAPCDRCHRIWIQH